MIDVQRPPARRTRRLTRAATGLCVGLLSQLTACHSRTSATATRPISPCARPMPALRNAPAGLPTLAIVLPLPVATMARPHDRFAERRRGNRSHDAIDLFAPTGTPITPVTPGWIVSLSPNTFGGNTVTVIDETTRVATYYAHLLRTNPERTLLEWVDAQTVLGWVGTTGDAVGTAPHLHLQVRALAAGETWHRGIPWNPAAPLAAATDCLLAR